MTASSAEGLNITQISNHLSTTRRKREDEGEKERAGREEIESAKVR